VKHHNAFKKFINNNLHTKIQNDTTITNDEKSIQPSNTKESIRLQQKSDILSKDEL